MPASLAAFARPMAASRPASLGSEARTTVHPSLAAGHSTRPSRRVGWGGGVGAAPARPGAAPPQAAARASAGRRRPRARSSGAAWRQRWQRARRPPPAGRPRPWSPPSPRRRARRARARPTRSHTRERLAARRRPPRAARGPRPSREPHSRQYACVAPAGEPQRGAVPRRRPLGRALGEGGGHQALARGAAPSTSCRPQVAQKRAPQKSGAPHVQRAAAGR